MAPQPETGKSGWLKLATACYYCLASMTVQYMNKVSRFCAYSGMTLFCSFSYRLIPHLTSLRLSLGPVK